MQTTQRHPAADDSGLGIVEIVVSMFLLALLAVAFLPLLVQGMRSSVQSSTVATASQLLNQQLDAVRAIPQTCDDVRAFVASPVAAVTDARGTVFRPERHLGDVLDPCPARYPGVVNVRIAVTEAGHVLAEAITLVYVESATGPALSPTPAPTASAAP